MRTRRFARWIGPLFGLTVLFGGSAPASAQVLFQMEGGLYLKTDTYSDPKWDQIVLQNTYVDPVVFIIPDEQGGHAADFRIGLIEPDSFVTTLVEPPAWDGPHIAQYVSYIVAEAGGWFLTSDIFIYVGYVDITNVVNSEEEDWLTVDLPQGFTNPIVLTQLQEMPNEENLVPTWPPPTPPQDFYQPSVPWFTAAVRNVTSTSFEVALDGGRCTQVSTAPITDCTRDFTGQPGFIPERVGFLVIEADLQETFVDANNKTIQLETILTGNIVEGYNDSNWPVINFQSTFPSSTPLFIAKPQTRNDPDGGWFRFRNLTASSVVLQVDEALGVTGNNRYHSTNPEAAGALLISEAFEVVDLDPDKDLIPVAYDNCPFVYNPGQDDIDHDGIGDACECGDGLVVAGEHCDDGNTTNGDGCSDQCLHEPGWWCEGEPSVCDGICGDSQVLGTEVCDDGNEIDDPACHSDCHSYCGDDALQPEHGEVCDGTHLGGLDCVNLGLGFTGGTLACDGVCEVDVSGCTLCGNGLLESHEVCDDGNTLSGDGCTEDCQPESGWTCHGEPSVCEANCGDGVILGFETCDDGGVAPGDGCSANCRVEVGWACAQEPSVCAPVCGDGTALAGEACDDGNLEDGDGCASDCTVEPGWVCPGGECVGVCGNGTLEAGEGCDDGNTTAGDGCVGCQVESGWACAGEPSYCVAVCGDGVMLGQEACDDGNALGGDGCAGTCQIEPGWACAGEPSVCTSSCGDGFVVDVETCDDGNNADGDGCSAACQVEPGYLCEGNPSECELACGNGRLDDREACDDGNTEDGDGCDADCGVEPEHLCEGEPSVCCLDEDGDGECDEQRQYILGSGGGCYCQGGPSSDPSLPLVLLGWLGVVAWRRRRRQ